MSTLKLKDELRNKLKENGFNKGFSISVKVYMSGYYILIKAKEEIQNKPLFYKICYSFEKIDRCKRTDEILQGGNNFVQLKFGDRSISFESLCRSEGFKGDIVAYYNNL